MSKRIVEITREEYIALYDVGAKVSCLGHRAGDIVSISWLEDSDQNWAPSALDAIKFAAQLEGSPLRFYTLVEE